jgi:hypothetical protein
MISLYANTIIDQRMRLPEADFCQQMMDARFIPF